MTDRDKDTIRIVYDEKKAIVAQLDAIADAEGTTRASLVRRIVRSFLLPSVPTFGQRPEAIDTADITA
jgi:hypothetical protein